MAVTAFVAHASNMVEECRGTFEFDCREQCVSRINGAAVKWHSYQRQKRRNAQTLLLVCEHVKALYFDDTQSIWQ